MSSVSKNIKKIRLQKKLTQEEMADKLFVTRQTVSNWENGKSQPDIDMLIKIADILNKDTTVLIYGFPDSEDGIKEKKHFIIACGILLILGLLLFFLTPLAARMESKYYLLQPMMLLCLYVFPVFWFLLGWAAIQGLGLLGIVKPVWFKSAKIIHYATLAAVLLYAALMTPWLIYNIQSLAQFFQYMQNPSLYPDGFSFTFYFPDFLNNIYQLLIDTVYKQPVLFVIPGIVLRLSKINLRRVE